MIVRISKNTFHADNTGFYDINSFRIERLWENSGCSCHGQRPKEKKKRKKKTRHDREVSNLTLQ